MIARTCPSPLKSAPLLNKKEKKRKRRTRDIVWTLERAGIRNWPHMYNHRRVLAPQSKWIIYRGLFFFLFYREKSTLPVHMQMQMDQGWERDPAVYV